MTPRELVDQLRIAIDDDLEPFEWSDLTLADYLQAGCEEYCLRRPIVDVTYSLSVGVSGWVELDPEILAIQRLEGPDGCAVDAVDGLHLDRIRPGWTGEIGNAIRGWLVTDGRIAKSLRVWPKPTAPVAVQLTVQRMPVTRVDAGEWVSELDFPVNRAEADAVTQWAGYLAYARRHKDAGDLKLAEQHRAAFEVAVGPRPDARAQAFRTWAVGRRPRVSIYL